MIGFRYHVVTVISVFMALGIGILLGGAAQDLFPAQQAVLFQRLEEKYYASQAENVKWSRKTRDLMKRNEQLEDVLKQLSPSYIRGKLAGKKIIMVQLEKGNFEKVGDWLEMAGAEVQAVVKVKGPNELLTHATLPVLARGLGTPDETNGGTLLAHSAQVLANSMTGLSSGDWPIFLQKQGWIDMQGRLDEKPDAVLILCSESEQESTRSDLFDIPFIKELQKQKIRIVGAERSDSELSVISIYRRLGVPTVDNLDQMSGMISIIELLRGQQGSYGVKQTADQLVPDLRI